MKTVEEKAIELLADSAKGNVVDLALDFDSFTLAHNSVCIGILSVEGHGLDNSGIFSYEDLFEEYQSTIFQHKECNKNIFNTESKL